MSVPDRDWVGDGVREHPCYTVEPCVRELPRQRSVLLLKCHRAVVETEHRERLDRCERSPVQRDRHDVLPADEHPRRSRRSARRSLPCCDDPAAPPGSDRRRCAWTIRPTPQQSIDPERDPSRDGRQARPGRRRHRGLRLLRLGDRRDKRDVIGVRHDIGGGVRRERRVRLGERLCRFRGFRGSRLSRADGRPDDAREKQEREDREPSRSPSRPPLAPHRGLRTAC